MSHAEGFLKLVSEARLNVRECTVDDVWLKMQQGENFILVDTREDGEWSKGHISQSIHIGKGVIERDLEAKIPDKHSLIILYCGGGFRSVLAAEAVQKMGYTNVISMDGGWRSWCEKGLPTAS